MKTALAASTVREMASTFEARELLRWEGKLASTQTCRPSPSREVPSTPFANFDITTRFSGGNPLREDMNSAERGSSYQGARDDRGSGVGGRRLRDTLRDPLGDLDARE